jgi:sialate O-acetylesterase
MRPFRRALAAAFLALLPLAPAAADVRLAAIFGDHMVVQQGVPVPVWGWADAGEEVSVSLGDRTGKATADAAGKWKVTLETLPAGGPHVLKVQGKNALERTDVLVGEVWLCSGQSNMGMTVNGCLNFDAEAKASDLPKLRMYTVARKTAEEPQADVPGDWKVSGPQTVGGFSAAAYFFGRRLHQEMGVPVGLINSSWGGTPIQAWTGVKTHESVPELAPLLENLKKSIASWDPEKAKARHEQQLADWKKRSDEAKAEGKPFAARRPNPPIDPKVSQSSPGRLYNAMIAPLVPYAIRGAIWYQGEANAGNAALYAVQLKAMVGAWRSIWGEGDFPFISVQLPNYMKAQAKPVEEGWAGIRETFLTSIAAIPNTGIAVTIDVGEADNIHPKDKQTVGHRLAQWALAKTYGKPLVACGPLYKGMKKDGVSIVCEFDCVGGGLVAKDGEKLKGFAIAGADRQFVWAEAKIEGQTVVVSSPEVKDPVAVRYAWANNPACNLCNKEGLPASPFRTDEGK